MCGRSVMPTTLSALLLILLLSPLTLLVKFLPVASAWCRVLVAMCEIRQLWIAFVLARHVACRLPILVRALTLHHGPVGFDPAFHVHWVHFRILRYHLAFMCW